VIRTFRHKGLRRLFEAGDASGINAQFVAKLTRQLTVLHSSTSPEDMDLPGYKLHPLKGERKGQWSVSVSANWRLVFAFEAGDAINVDLVDYH
jgi:proteic killer suppression protein